MAVSVQVLDPSDTAALDATQALYEETERSTHPAAFLYGRAEYESVLRNVSPETFSQVLVVRDGDAILGHALCQARTADNTHAAYARTWVPPRLARRGTGSALVAAAED